MPVSLNPHPRLYISAEHLRQLQAPAETAALKAAAKFVREDAQRLLTDLDIPTSEGKHNWHLLLERNGGKTQDWYYKKPDTNWNTVCNGGAGMLALALYEYCPEAARVLELVEQGVAPYFESMSADGGWPEGIGYWNYGMRYGFMY